MLLKPMTLRAGGWRENESLLPGTVVPGSVCSGWKLHNRLMMKENRMVRFFMSPDEAAEAGAQEAELAREHPERAQVKSAEDIRRRRIEGLAAARAAKAEKAKALLATA